MLISTLRQPAQPKLELDLAWDPMLVLVVGLDQDVMPALVWVNNVHILIPLELEQLAPSLEQASLTKIHSAKRRKRERPDDAFAMDVGRETEYADTINQVQ